MTFIYCTSCQKTRKARIHFVTLTQIGMHLIWCISSEERHASTAEENCSLSNGLQSQLVLIVPFKENLVFNTSLFLYSQAVLSTVEQM